MTFTEVFEAYYNLYRLEADVPATTDDEYPIAIRLANEAINRWAAYDGTYWKELFTTLQATGVGGTKIVSVSQTYTAPTNMKEVGGYVRVFDLTSGTTLRRYPIIEPQDIQFQGDQTSYCYFTGDSGNGFVMHLNPIPDTSIIGKSIDYVYYKKPTLITVGASVNEMSEPYFMVHRMLANRFRGSRNPYYASAKTDAEDLLKTMQMANNSGNWSNPWKLADNSGAAFGVDAGNTNRIF